MDNKSFKIISFGEVLFDVYPDNKRLGGAPFNFIYHMNRLSGNVRFVSGVGDDKNGTEILTKIKDYGISDDFIKISNDHPTGKVVVTLNHNNIPSYKIIENTAYDFIELTNEEIEELNNFDPDLIYFGTLAQRNLTSRNTLKKIAKLPGKKFFDINLRQNFYSDKIITNSLEMSDIVKLNDEELVEVNKIIGSNHNSNLEIMAGRISKKFDIELLCVTIGDKGSLLASKDNFNRFKPLEIETVDTLGAGDAFSSIIATGALLNISLDKLNRYANKFAGEICRINGALPENDDMYKNYRKILKNE